ncbi:hypothetical protein BDW74DRAFT_174757 [Aspergillus multicolor]|uniref:uncharacterized protein n=1 Tax=Aspergillus multicolor TaxID=41759 RepID=UPI003CCCBEF7
MTPSILNSVSTNEGSSEITATANTTHTTTDTAMVSWTSGYEVSLTESITFGVPLIEGGTITSAQKWTASTTWSTTTTNQDTWGGGVTVHVPPHSEVTVTSTTQQGQMDIPATAYFRTKSGHEVAAKTIFKGTQYYDEHYVVHEAVPIGTKGMPESNRVLVC